MKKLPIEKIDLFFQKLAEKYPVYLPVDDETGKPEFTRYKENTKLSTQLNTVRSAKDFFFPQVETMMKFKMEGKKIEIESMFEEKEDFVIFGVRGCDVRSFDILDSVYLADPIDTFYKNRRDHGIVISLACSKPDSTCFCTVFDIDATNPEGDITAWRTSDAIYFRTNNDKGNEVLLLVDSILEETKEDMVEEQRRQTKEILNRLPFNDLDLSYFKEENTMEIFKSDKWASLSESCLACGTCTFVCPTCQCYDIREYNTGHGVERFRC